MEHRKGYVRLINDQMAPSPLTSSMASSVFRRLSKRADMVKDGFIHEKCTQTTET